MPNEQLSDSDQIELQDRIWNDPEFFHREILGYTPWEKQIEISESIRDHRNTAVRSCNGAGKTFHIAREGLRFLYSFPNSVVINTAPTWTQIENQYWRYMREAYNSALIPLGGKLLKTELSIGDTWFAKGIANNPDNVASFQGWHAENIMMVFDEASGIPVKIWEAAVGAMSGGSMVRFVVIGNPNSNSGPFYDAFKDPTFNKIRISAFDIPNVKEKKPVVPGLTDHHFVEEIMTRYGVNSPAYKVRVLGEFPDQASNTLIGIDLIESAMNADRELQNQADDVAGLDVARFGDDDSALVRRTGNKAKVEWIVNGNNTMELAGKSALYLRENKTVKLYIDITGGLGAGVYDRLKEQRDISSRVYGVNVAGQAREPETFLNIRIESWHNVALWLRDAILEKHEGFYELAQPTYKITSNGKMQLEGKEDLKKRGVPSPNVGDALALTLSRATEGSNLGLVWL
jgi:phage terminase large subunit